MEQNIKFNVWCRAMQCVYTCISKIDHSFQCDMQFRNTFAEQPMFVNTNVMFSIALRKINVLFDIAHKLNIIK